MATTTAAVTTEVPGVVKFGLNQINNPTPEVVRRIVRALTWATGLYALSLLFFDLKDFGVPELTEIRILKVGASVTGFVSVLARLFGVEPVNFMYNRRQE